jgi:hypothetical protein
MALDSAVWPYNVLFVPIADSVDNLSDALPYALADIEVVTANLFIVPAALTRPPLAAMPCLEVPFELQVRLHGDLALPIERSTFGARFPFARIEVERLREDLIAPSAPHGS